MPEFLKQYGCTEGPLGVPCTDAVAFALDRLIEQAGGAALKRAHVPHSLAEVVEEERTDVSWITTADVDLDREIVNPKGMDPSLFLQNPVVTLNHSYWLPPVGRCLRLWDAAEGGRKGVKGKSQYPARPDGHAGEWPPDDAWAMIKGRLLAGKSIGFLPLERRDPKPEEEARGVRRVVERWMLLEYAVTSMPANPFATVSGVGKSFARALGLDPVELRSWEPRAADQPPPRLGGFTTLAEARAMVERAFDVDPDEMARRACEQALHRHRGGV